MPTVDKRIDDYISAAEPFARPILKYLRKVIHKACPDVTENIKWGMPSFDYKGLLCGIAAFRRHCTFGFWKQQLLSHPSISAESNTLSSFGRITSLDDLPAEKELIEIIHQAMELNELGIKPDRTVRSKGDVVVPEMLAAALKDNKKAAETFDNFPPSCRREYIEWIIDAKTEPTRIKRLATTIEWLSQGKKKNWKYEKT